MKYLRCLSLFTIIVVILSFAGTPTKKKQKGGREQSNVMFNFAERIKQGFNMRVWLSNQMTMGLQAWDGDASVVPDGIGLEYPAGSLIEHLYGAGPRLGAIIDGVIRVTEGYNGFDARKEFQPEQNHLSRDRFWRTAIGSNLFDSLGYSGYYYNQNIIVNRKGVDDDEDAKVDEDELDGNDNDGDWNPATDDVGSDGLADPYEISCDGNSYDPVSNPDPAGDNYDPAIKDKCHPNPDGTLPYKNDPNVYTEKNGIPDHGEPHVDEDYGAISNSDLYCSATDTFLSPIIPGHVPMGAKIIQKSYAWSAAVVDAIIFLDYRYINLSRKMWQDTYIGFFADMDVGSVNVDQYFLHNYVAYDSSTRTAYTHNPIDVGSTPLGLTILSTSKPFDSLKVVFQWFYLPIKNDPGTNDELIYDWLSGGRGLIAPDQSPTDLSDSRFFVSFGPFSQVYYRDTLKSVFALVSGMNVAEMLNNARRAKEIFDNDYMVGVVDINKSIPKSFSLRQNYPNPFNPITKIQFDIPKVSDVSLIVYDLLGREVVRLVDEIKSSGHYEVIWDGSHLASGVYFYRLHTNNFTAVNKMLLIR